jgi:cardiolipin synthase
MVVQPRLEVLARSMSRVVGSPPVPGNAVRLLRDAADNYPAWLAAIRSARRYIFFESYIIYADGIGRSFADALRAKAHEGVQVCVIYDWLGAFGKTPRWFWRELRDAGVAVRCFNPPKLSSPLGWVQRDHRKLLSVDGEVSFVTGMCVGDAWAGDPVRGIEPWRDTGIEIRGPAVVEVERAFAELWATMGEPLPAQPEPATGSPACGDVSLRIVATTPGKGGLLRLDEMIAAVVRERLWLTDAYFAGIPSYVQALVAAAREGVDVRILVPGSSDIAVLRDISRLGYRPLLQAGVRVFEWKGPMMHAKTAVADGWWARVGSSNLNVASWVGNHELDAVIEDHAFAAQLEQMYLQDLEHATEIVLDKRTSRRDPRLGRGHTLGGRASAGRATAGALRLGSAVAAAMTDQRVLASVEPKVAGLGALVFLVLALLAIFLPLLITVPLAALLLWLGLSLLAKAFGLRRRARGPDRGGA